MSVTNIVEGFKIIARTDDLESAFINQVNQNLGIMHKVGRIYFQDTDEREDVMQEMMYQLWRRRCQDFKSIFLGFSKFVI